MTDDTLNPDNCGCKYCRSSRKGQTEISKIPGPKTGSPSNSNLSTRYSHKPKLRLVAQLRKRPTAGNISIDRNSDLRASRRFRVGEVVWCTLSPPIQGEHKDEWLAFWPGFVNETRLKSDVLPHISGSEWHVVQSTVYKVKLLALKHSFVMPEVAALPYQAYAPSMELIERLRLSGHPALLQDRQRLSDFRPIPVGVEAESGPQARFADASTPFALAIQIAAHLVRMWTPTDEWKFLGDVPSAAASVSAGSVATELQETCHQGLWWGAERIWADELVRIKSARSQVMPQGSPFIKHASPSADARGVFMRINSIISIPEGTPKDRPRECRVAGLLYELADEVYEEEPSEVSPANGSETTDVSRQLLSPDQTGSGSSVMKVDLFRTIRKGNNTVTETSSTQITSQRPDSNNSSKLFSFPLPKPPDGYKFRPIMNTGSEIVLDVSLIAGRYYPELLKHPLLQNTLADVNPNDTHVSQLALCGLLPGAMNSMECVDWVSTRIGMIQHADATAYEDLLQHWHPFDVEMKAVNHGEEGEKKDVAQDPAPN